MSPRIEREDPVPFMQQRPTPSHRYRAYVSSINVTQLHRLNPWMCAWWSFAFPGCGHLSQGRKLQGLLLMVWEIVINTKSQINLAILDSLLGDFDGAKAAINQNWFLAYVALYVYAIWDSYRFAVDANKLYLLADREDVPTAPFYMDGWSINFLDKRKPWAAAWSLLAPGLGHMYAHKIIDGFSLIVWSLAMLLCSHTLPSFQLTLMGDFAGAHQTLNMQWFLYFPSFYAFSIYDAYVTVVEYNKLFEKEQARYLKANYQRVSFAMPV